LWRWGWRKSRGSVLSADAWVVQGRNAKTGFGIAPLNYVWHFADARLPSFPCAGAARDKSKEGVAMRRIVITAIIVLALVLLLAVKAW